MHVCIGFLIHHTINEMACSNHHEREAIPVPRRVIDTRGFFYLQGIRPS